MMIGRDARESEVEFKKAIGSFFGLHSCVGMPSIEQAEDWQLELYKHIDKTIELMKENK